MIISKTKKIDHDSTLNCIDRLESFVLKFGHFCLHSFRITYFAELLSTIKPNCVWAELECAKV